MEGYARRWCEYENPGGSSTNNGLEGTNSAIKHYYTGREKKGLKDIVKLTGELLDEASTEESQEKRLSHGNPTGAELKKAELFLNKFHFAFETGKGKYCVLYHILPRIRRFWTLYDISTPIMAFLYKI